MLFLPLSSIIFWSYYINFYRYGPIIRVTRRTLLTIALFSLVASTKTIPATNTRVSSNTPIVTILHSEIVPFIIDSYRFFNKVVKISDSRSRPNQLFFDIFLKSSSVIGYQRSIILSYLIGVFLKLSRILGRWLLLSEILYYPGCRAFLIRWAKYSSYFHYKIV